MSDALCGPSNPLQQFKQQSQLDRTLQQDRLTSRHPLPTQNFRSHNPNAGILDPEFEAFQAGVPPSELAHFQPFHHQPPAPISGPSQAPTWATDFQRMQISPPPPPTFQQPYAPHQAAPGSVNWAQGFREHVTQAAPRAQNSSPSPQAFQYRARYGMTGFQNNFAQPSYAPPPVQSKGKEAAAVEEHFDEAAFERAFDRARDDMMADVEPLEFEEVSKTVLLTTAEQEINVEQLRREGMAAIHAAQTGLVDNNILLSPDPKANVLMEDIVNEQVVSMQGSGMESEEEPQSQQQEDDDDALANTAHELLEKVEHNQTDKFRNSQFLSLMRKLRDREVKVEGDKMVETIASANAVTNEPLNTSSTTTTTLPLFDNTEQRPSPLVPQAIDTRPPDYGIPLQEQDLDAGRIDPRDGQAVVELLNQRQSDADHPDDIAGAAAPRFYDPEYSENYADALFRG